MNAKGTTKGAAAKRQAPFSLFHDDVDDFLRYDDEFYDFLTKMSDIGIDKELIGCFERLFDDRDNVNPCDYIDTLTPGQIKKLRIKHDRIIPNKKKKI